MEILIALTVFAILAAITSSAMYNAFTTKSRVTKQADDLLTLQLAITLIEKDTQQIINRSVLGSGMHLFPAFIGKNNYMELTRGGLTNPDSNEQRSTLVRVAILCNEQSLVRRTWLALDTPDRNQYEDKVLLKNLNRCQLAYLNENLQVLPEWHATSLPQDKELPKLPKAVQLTLGFKDWGKASFLFIIPQGLYAKP